MKEIVLDASVILKWFSTAQEQHHERARSLQMSFAKGQLRVVAPRLLMLEVLNAAARGWKWTAEQVAELATDIVRLNFELVDPALPDVARWTAQGLTSYDASYVAVAEMSGIPLITVDRQILATAPGVACSLADAA
jgi:predicted nucleic acid-binding protein